MRYLPFVIMAVLSFPVESGTDTVIKDFDISMSQSECQDSAIRIFQSVVHDDTPVMQLEHIIFYSREDSELIAVCRADKGLLVLFTQGPLTEKVLVLFHEKFSGQSWRQNP
jgi:hypothetical protein